MWDSAGCVGWGGSYADTVDTDTGNAGRHMKDRRNARLLRTGASRLLWPGVRASYTNWKGHWEVEQLAALQQGITADAKRRLQLLEEEVQPVVRSSCSIAKRSRGQPFGSMAVQT